MKGIDISFSNQDSPTPSQGWQALTNGDRVRLLQEGINSFNASYDVVCIEACKGGQVLLVIGDDEISACERGKLLLDLEEYLKENMDYGITLWLKPAGDKSSLRKLRGIEVR